MLFIAIAKIFVRTNHLTAIRNAYIILYVLIQIYGDRISIKSTWWMNIDNIHVKWMAGQHLDVNVTNLHFEHPTTLI